MDLSQFRWTREPQRWEIAGGTVRITTQPHTDLWQRTYYHFRNDNAPVFQTQTDEQYFSFIVKVSFGGSSHRYEQSGVVLYLDSENWIKCAAEYENEEFQHLGSVVTNHGFSDWATAELSASVRTLWYRLSRRADDYKLECSQDGARWQQMRICHMAEGGGTIRFGIFACSPEDSSFTAEFSELQMLPCAWAAHDGQPPDEDG